MGCASAHEGRVTVFKERWEFSICHDQDDYFECYFDPHPNCELADVDLDQNNTVKGIGWPGPQNCVYHASNTGEYRAGAMEFMFSTLHKWVADFYEKTRFKVFKDAWTGDMITVHLRRTDK